MSLWLIAQTRLQWQQKYERHPELYEEFKIEVLPMLSVANVRSLLRAVMPLSELNSEQAIEQVVEHLVKRTRSRKSRMKQHFKAMEKT